MMARVMFVVCAIAVLGGTAFAANLGGEIGYLEGQATIDGAPATIGDVVPLGATVTTGARSQCEIIFREKNIIRLGESTAFVFHPFNLQNGSELKTGSLTLVLKNLVGSAAGSPRFLVHTQTTTCGVRGTSFFMKVEDPNSTYVCLCNGAITIDDGSQSGMEVVAAHHGSYWLKKKDGAISVSKAPMLYHSDDDMETLAGKIGVSIDWTVADH